MKRSFIFIIPLVLLCCSSPQFIGMPTQDASIIPGGTMVVVSKEGLAISACKVPTPYGQGNRILAFSVELINQTDQPIEFLPKDIFLFDQLNRQFPPLPPEALIEASVNRFEYDARVCGFRMGRWRMERPLLRFVYDTDISLRPFSL